MNIQKVKTGVKTLFSFQTNKQPTRRLYVSTDKNQRRPFANPQPKERRRILLMIRTSKTHNQHKNALSIDSFSHSYNSNRTERRSYTEKTPSVRNLTTGRPS